MDVEIMSILYFIGQVVCILALALVLFFMVEIHKDDIKEAKTRSQHFYSKIEKFKIYAQISFMPIIATLIVILLGFYVIK